MPPELLSPPLFFLFRCCPKCRRDQHSLDNLDGDYYCRIRFGGNLVKRTRTAYQNASPYFDEKWQMIVPHYKAMLIVEMIDAANDRPVGSVTLSTYGLLQRDADAVAEGRDPVLQEDHVLREVMMHSDICMYIHV